MRRWIGTLLGIGALLTALASGWSLAQNPFAEPFRARTADEMRVVLGNALDGISSRDVADRARTALSEGRPGEAAALLRFAERRDLALPTSLVAEIEAVEAETTGWSSCLACAFDPSACPTLTSVAACNLPVEMTPVGDANAVRRALTDYVNGDEIDTVDLSLAVVGLAATGAIVISVGASATVKAGATLLRVARKAGAVRPGLMNDIAALSARTLRLDYAGGVVRGRRPLGDLIEDAPAAELAAISASVGTLARNVPAGDALAVLRYADGADELAALARVSDVAGPETRGALDVLGKTRVMRMASRLSEAVILAMALIAALFGQLLALALWLTRRTVRPT